tara:strand:- start:192 stop:905 length:714 start_codon:yes stop_codon:yes gene_type:complete
MVLTRSIIYFVFMILSTIFFSLLIIALGIILPSIYSDKLSTWWGKFNIFLQRWICGLILEIEGQENIPSSKAIIMCKHQSTWETIALRGLLPFKQSWVVKKELINIPLFGIALKFSGAISLDRKSGRKAVVKLIKEGKSCLANGRLIVIFPEGTRTAYGQKAKYSPGGAILAESSGCPVVPIAHNAGIFWARRSVKKYPGVIKVKIGAPIKTENRKASEILKEVEEWIESQMDVLIS